MRRLITSFYLLSVLLVLNAQESPVIKGNYPGQTFISFAEQLGENEAIQFYFASEWVDSLEVVAVKSGTSLAAVMDSIVLDKPISYFIEERQVYVFPGDDIVSELPRYKAPEGYLNQPDRDQLEEQEEYVKIQNMSEENFITVGSAGSGENGRDHRVLGRIINSQTGEALIGATIYLVEREEGFITDAEGMLRMMLPAGSYRIRVNHMAMKEKEYGLNVLSDGTFTISLENELIELEEITVSDQRRSNVESVMMGFERMTAKSIKEVPVVLGEKDVLKVVQMLPGVQNAGEGSSGFNVRGGSADQNMFYINNVSIYNTSHLFGFFTAFSPDIISDFSLYKNNVPAKYGGRIASIFEISTRQGNKNNFFAQGGISPITGHVSVEGPVVKEKVSFAASFRSTYSDWLLKRMNDYDLRNSDASFYDATLGLNANLNSNNQVKAFFYQSSDDFSLSSRNDYKYANTGGSLSWKHNFSKSLAMDLSFASSNYRFSTVDKNNVSEAFQHDYFVEHSEARLDLLSLAFEDHRLEFGVNSVLYQLNRGEILPYGDASRRLPIDLGRERAIENAVYLSDEYRIIPRLSLLFGLRYSFYGHLGPGEVNLYKEGLPRNDYNFLESTTIGKGEFEKTYGGLEPRAALNFRISNNSSVKASYNRLRQYIFLLSNTVAIAPNDQWKLTDYHISPPVSDQVSLGYYHDLEDPGINISIEVYRKWVNDIVEYKDGADFISPDPLETQILQGTQDSYGVEFMAKKTSDRLTGWFSYTYFRSMVLINGPYDEMKVNNGNPYPSNYDRPHSLNLVANYRINKRLSFSSNLVYASGRPVTLPVAAYYAEDQPFLLYSSRNAYRIPDYFRIDLSLNLEGNLKYKKIAHSFWMLNVYNLLGRDNAYSVFYEVEGDEILGYQLSIFARPIVTLSWNFKFGNYNSD